MLSRLIIGETPIDFASLERRAIILILNADNERCFSFWFHLYSLVQRILARSVKVEPMERYEVKTEVPSAEDYIRIRLAAGLSEKTKEAANLGLKNSLFAVTVFYDSEPVGIGRVIGDGGCFFEIVDIAVLPEHQGRGLGQKIMEALMDYIHSHAPKSAYVSLMADHGTPAFYARFGFTRAELPKSAGMYLRIT